jgi:hypothetical protein
MGGFQPAGQLHAQSKDGLFRQGTSGQFLVETCPRDILGYQIVNRIVTEVVGGGNVRVIQLAYGTGFLAKSLSGTLVGQYPGCQDFEGHIPVETLVAGTPDVTLATTAYPFD